MNIGVIDNVPVGGAKRVVYEQIKGLSNKHEIFWVTNKVFAELDARSYCTEFEELTFDLSKKKGWNRPIQDWQEFEIWKREYSKAATFFEYMKVDVILAHPDLLTQAPLILMLSNIPKVYYAEEWLRVVYEPELHPVTGGNLLTRQYEKMRRKWIQRLDQKLTAAAGKVLVNSQYQQTNYVSAYGVDATVIYPGVDTDVFSPATMPRQNHFLFVGSNTENEGYDLIEQIMNSENIPIRTIDFSEKGFAVSDTELVREYSQAIGVLSLSKKEPFGMIPIEAMACEAVCIARNQGGYRETVLDGVTGYLVEGEVDEIVSKMNLLLADSSRRLAMGKLARKHVKEKFSWKTHIASLEEILREEAK